MASGVCAKSINTENAPSGVATRSILPGTPVIFENAARTVLGQMPKPTAHAAAAMVL